MQVACFKLRLSSQARARQLHIARARLLDYEGMAGVGRRVYVERNIRI